MSSDVVNIEHIRSVIAETLMIPDEQLTDTAKIEEVVQDSMDIVELIAVLSNTFRVRIDTQELDNIVTMEDVYAYVQKNAGTLVDGGFRGF